YKLPKKFDPVAATDALEEQIVEPLRAAQALVYDCAHVTQLFTTMEQAVMRNECEERVVERVRACEDLVADAAHVTRLFTTMDPEEMTVDPQLVFNADVEQELAFAHTAADEQHWGFL